MKQADIIANVQNAVEFAYNNSYSSWYRDHCIKHGRNTQPIIEAPDDISALPFITRADLNTVNLLDRTFRSPQTANEIRSTSGTSGQGALFYMRDVLYRKMGLLMHARGGRRKLIFWNYNMAVSTLHSDRLAGLQTVVGDPHQLNKNINLVKQLSIDILSGTPSLLLLFGGILKPTGLHKQIRFIETQGEHCTAQTLQALTNLFPNADHYSQYSMGEVGLEIGMRMPSCSRQDSNYYHINEEDIYVEMIDEELVITRFNTPTVMPLIRYRTGDSIGWVGYDKCTCGHKGLSLELLGRQNVDFVRIAGVELRSELIAAIVGEFHVELDSFVATEIRDRVANNTQKITISVEVVPLTPQTTDLDDLKRRLQNSLMRSLKVSSTTTLGEMVSSGLFDVPAITFLGKRPTGSKQPGIKRVTSQDQSSPTRT